MSKTKNKNFYWIEYLRNVSSIQQLRENLATYHRLLHFNSLREIVIVGTAEEGQRLWRLCNQWNIRVLFLCDDNPAKQGLTIDHYKIHSTDCLETIDKSTPIVIASHRVLKPTQRLRAKGFKTVIPFAVLQVLYGDKFPPHMFYARWLEALFENRDQLDTLIPLLEDYRSVEVLNRILGFRLTLNPEQLTSIIEWDLYGPGELLHYSDHEIYIDGGAFDGDTINSFIHRMQGKFKKIIGFEPDQRTFQSLQSRFVSESRVEVVNKGLYSHTDTLYFDNIGTRASALISQEQSNVVKVPVTSIDETLNGEPITYIKMNIEGAEIPALQGATNSLAQYKPKLGISVYHRPTDLWEIPLLIKRLNADYKFHLRQHDGGVIESVLYAL